MIYQVVVTRRARANALQTLVWKAEKSSASASRWYAGLEKAIAKLSRNPELHPVVEEDSERLGITLRQMIYGRRRGVYRLLFSVEGETVTLHEIRHSARDSTDF